MAIVTSIPNGLGTGTTLPVVANQILTSPDHLSVWETSLATIQLFLGNHPSVRC